VRNILLARDALVSEVQEGFLAFAGAFDGSVELRDEGIPVPPDEIAEAGLILVPTEEAFWFDKACSEEGRYKEAPSGHGERLQSVPSIHFDPFSR